MARAVHLGPMRRRGKIIPFPGLRSGSPPPRVPARRLSDDVPGLVDVHRCDQAEALVVKGLLESEGIPTVLRARLAHSVYPFSVGQQGEVVVLVPEWAVTRSRLLLARVSGGPSLF
ncbi:MAG TPA: hypothetical protein VFR64_09400 [Methylomirabilota bacterium]|nr:hypothetical protein [Methylomirabilota bacterium]